MDGKKDLATKHLELISQLKRLSSMLHDHSDSTDPLAVMRLDYRIHQLEQAVVREKGWRSPFSTGAKR
ncbi:MULTISPECIES: hypothetical protein [Pseudomonas]|uniref:hypothetical protein n=1 Tax=Pseudomonas TaxID=286 RepID=UPI000AA08C6F|nr:MULTISPECIES: hypothetical protein [Pseudomonas]MBF8728740.1 hypothetical protein [Pseudomonas putida]MEC4024552.1 hypothetical protein [Pseudomonas fulva]